jgi:hypothetical protein
MKDKEISYQSYKEKDSALDLMEGVAGYNVEYWM